MKARLRAVLFDLDGTLVDTLPDLAASVNFALGRLERPVRTLGEIRGFIGDGVTQLLRDSLGPAHGGLVESALQLFTPHYLEHCAVRSALYPGVAETLDRLSGFPLGVVTNKPEAPSLKLLRALGLAERFKVFICGDTLPVKKPDPAMVREAARRLGVPPESTILVGDAPGDVRAAHGAGALALGVGFGYRPAEELRAAGADFIAERFSDIPGFLEDRT